MWESSDNESTHKNLSTINVMLKKVSAIDNIVSFNCVWPFFPHNSLSLFLRLFSDVFVWWVLFRCANRGRSLRSEQISSLFILAFKGRALNGSTGCDAHLWRTLWKRFSQRNWNCPTLCTQRKNLRHALPYFGDIHHSCYNCTAARLISRMGSSAMW